MKKILKLSLLLTVLFTTMSTYAIDGDFLLFVKKENGKVINFSINGIKKVNLSIYDKDNILIFTETSTGKNGISKAYNLDEFPAGTYYLEVENNFKKVRHEIVIKDQISTLSKRPITEVYKSSLNIKNQNVANFN
jgi:hypothetical protein